MTKRAICTTTLVALLLGGGGVESSSPGASGPDGLCSAGPIAGGLEPSQGSRSEDPSDLGAALRATAEGQTITLPAGTHAVDNPIVVRAKGVRIVGQGKDATVVTPRNAGRPVFRILANDVKLRGLTIDASVRGGEGRATFAVEIWDCKGCEVSGTKILNTGASSIKGWGLSDCLVDDNTILNAGDDAIQVRGTRMTISRNVMRRYFDEAVDAAGYMRNPGERIVVRNNRARDGRIALVIDDATNSAMQDNVVDDNDKGIAVTAADSIVSGNVVRNSRSNAYSIYKAKLVEGNRAEASGQAAFKLWAMRRATVRRNVVSVAPTGIELIRSSRNLVELNVFSGVPTDRTVVVGPESQGNDIRTPPPASPPAGADSVSMRLPVVGEEPALEAEPLDSYTGGVRVMPSSERGKKNASRLAAFLKDRNPGFTTIAVGDAGASSEITRDLHTTLRGAANDAIGVVRVPYFIVAGRGKRSLDLWYLTVDGQRVALVSRLRSPPEVTIAMMDRGRLGLGQRLSLFAERLLLFLFG